MYLLMFIIVLADFLLHYKSQLQLTKTNHKTKAGQDNCTCKEKHTQAMTSKERQGKDKQRNAKICLDMKIHVRTRQIKTCQASATSWFCQIWPFYFLEVQGWLLCPPRPHMLIRIKLCLSYAFIALLRFKRMKQFYNFR